MQELVRVAVDAMGGDHAPQEIVKGAVEAVNSQKQVKVYLVGKEAAVQAELQKYQYDPSRVEVVDAAEVIGMAEPPVQAIRTKKDSSIVVAMKMVKNGGCLCRRREYGSGSGGWTADRWKDQRCGASSACSSGADGKGNLSAH